MTPTRVFAIGFKDWIELRAAHQPPKASTTRSTIQTDKKLVLTKLDEGGYGFITIETPHTINTTVYLGGRVLCTLRRHKFVAMTEMTGVRNGKMKELPLLWATMFLNRKWRRKYAGR